MQLGECTRDVAAEWGTQGAVPSLLAYTASLGAHSCCFLLLKSTKLIVACGTRIARLPSLYLDDQGDDAADLLRGKRLTLSNERFQYLQRLWTAAAFDMDSRVYDESRMVQ